MFKQVRACVPDAEKHLTVRPPTLQKGRFFSIVITLTVSRDVCHGLNLRPKGTLNMLSRISKKGRQLRWNYATGRSPSLNTAERF
jgi:hypothetical protein